MMKQTTELMYIDGIKQIPTLGMWKPSLINEKKMAAVIKHEHILHSLSPGNISSNELFYHAPYLAKRTNQYNSLLSRNNIDLTNDTWIKETVMNKIIL